MAPWRHAPHHVPMTIDPARFDPDCFVRHVRICDNAVLPGRRVRLLIGSAAVGWVLPEYAPRMPLADAAAFDAHVAQLRTQGAFRSRRELFDVRDDATGAKVATVDRGALPVLGIATAGVHLNGLVRRDDGLHLWVGRRAPDKRLDPDKLDQITAGGVASGFDARQTLIKEGAEEASLPERLARAAKTAGTLCYAMERNEGLRRDRLHCFDLELPPDFTPQPADGEVVGFALWPIGAVVQCVAESDDFKFNVNLVLIDLFLRRGILDRTSPAGRILDAAMDSLRDRPR
jgi:hypothetical protein